MATSQLKIGHTPEQEQNGNNLFPECRATISAPEQDTVFKMDLFNPSRYFFQCPSHRGGKGEEIKNHLPVQVVRKYL